MFRFEKFMTPITRTTDQSKKVGRVRKLVRCVAQWAEEIVSHDELV